MTDKEIHKEVHHKTEYVSRERAKLIFSEQDYGQYGISTYIEISDDTSEKALETFEKLMYGFEEEAKKAPPKPRHERASRAVEIG